MKRIHIIVREITTPGFPIAPGDYEQTVYQREFQAESVEDIVVAVAKLGKEAKP